MAISKIAGPMLLQNLDRQGVPLQFTTDGSTLLYLNFSQNRIGVNTLATTETLTVGGNLSLPNLKIDGTTISTTANLTLAPSGKLNLPVAENIVIPGGNTNYVLTTDGLGNLSWQNPTVVTSSTVGNVVPLGTPTDGNLIVNSAYRNWNVTTTVTDAVDDLNQVMLNVYQNTYVGAVDFTANVTQGPSSLTVQFNATAIGNPNSWLWDFGDSSTSTVQNPIKTYTNPNGGLYTVTVTARNTGGTGSGTGTGAWAAQTKTDFITLYTPIPIPSFVISDSDVDTGTAVSITNTSLYATSYVIDWGDSTSDVVPNNLSPGGTIGGPITHIYPNASSDSVYNIVISATSLTAGPSPVTVNSGPQSVRVYRTHTPLITSNVNVGNNAHTFYANGAPNIYGMDVNFTNLTATNPGFTSLFGAGNYYRWDFGDGTTTNVNIGSSAAGDTGEDIVKNYKLDNPLVQQTFYANLSVYNGHSLSPFLSDSIQIIVNPAPTAQFSAVLPVQSDRIGDTALTGYIYTDLNGANRATVNFINTSYNTDTYMYTFGDSTTSGIINEGDPGSPTGSNLTKIYTTPGTYTVSLLATGPNSLNLNDDTFVRTDYIIMLPPPPPPTGLSSQTLSFSAQSVGVGVALAANALDNTGGNAPAAGSSITRITTANLTSATINNVYDAHTGILTSELNGVEDGSIALTPNVDIGTNGSLTITSDVDARTVWPTIYPSDFYKVFSANYSRTNSTIPVGVNRAQLKHTITGNSSFGLFVKDDLTAVPNLDVTAASLTTGVSGTLLYISGIPYYTTGAQLNLTGVQVSNWIGQTYRDTSTPLIISNGTVVEGSGTIISTQTRTYANLNGAINYLTAGIPNAGTGQLTPYEFGALGINVNGSGALVGKIRLQLDNVNGSSNLATVEKNIQLFTTTPTGFVETNIPVSPTLGSFYTDNGKRIITGWSGDNPVFSSTTNYFVDNAFVGNINIEGTDEAVVRWGVLAPNNTDYSSYLPEGPDLSLNPTTQYIRVAFRRQTLANFYVTFTGKISGFWIAAPGTQVDTTSTLNGWLDASIPYAGVGLPGANTTAGGNGSNGCAYTAGDVIPLGTTQTNKTCRLTLGTENASNSFGNQIFINIKLAPGDSLSALSIS